MKKSLILFIIAALLSGLSAAGSVPKSLVVYSYDEDYAKNAALSDSIGELISLITAREKRFPVPVELINETDVLISSLGRKEEMILDHYQLLSNNVFTDSLRFLRTLSSKDYTKKGNWESIKPISSKRQPFKRIRVVILRFIFTSNRTGNTIRISEISQALI